MKASEINIAEEMVHITSYNHLKAYHRCCVDMTIIDRRKGKPVNRVYKQVWIFVVENPMARVKGILVAKSPQSVRCITRFSQEADFEQNTVTVSFRGQC